MLVDVQYSIACVLRGLTVLTLYVTLVVSDHLCFTFLVVKNKWP